MRGEPDFATPAAYRGSGDRGSAVGPHRYADNRGEPALRRPWRKTRLGSTTPVGNSDYGWRHAGDLCGSDGAARARRRYPVCPIPIYDAYQSPIRLGGRPYPPREKQCGASRIRLTSEALEAACTPRDRVLLLNTPGIRWEPYFTQSELEAIAEFVVPPQNLTLISDEIYEEITYDARRSPPHFPARCCASAALLVNSLSKTLCDDRLAARLLCGADETIAFDVAGPAAVKPRTGDVCAGCRRGSADRTAGLRAEMRREYASTASS